MHPAVNSAPITEAARGIGRPDDPRVLDITVDRTPCLPGTAAWQFIANGGAEKTADRISGVGRRGKRFGERHDANPAATLDRIGHKVTLRARSPGAIGNEYRGGIGAFRTEHAQDAPGQKTMKIGATVPYGYTGPAEDLTGMAVSPTSEEADAIVAQTCNVDGGQWIS
ncbi:hypothetical protein [Dinoroseobacter shibae]|jgi:hypothetical protein|uniref:hypothetical protein n=1 Tax=Dinoroseobacter shibae TaxID=215813 RepID=UPI0000E99CB1|nr:hypothetical protein [Dinoroseobacter shibae]URF47651.1 hypothetical protein M8008_05020 [Dinoroseobacter shibae]URF51961.1 hypothetical protein M8007_05020 [Dinoroseobacter shibae]